VTRWSIGVDGVPAVGAEGLDWQHLVGRLAHGLFAGFGTGVSAFGLAGVGVSTDDRREVGKQQLVRDQLAGQQRAWLAHREGERAAQVGTAHAASELLVAPS
jgi:hypothetical protein